MKKRISVALLALAVLMLAGCAGKAETAPAADKEPTQETQDQQTQSVETEAQETEPLFQPEYAGVYMRTWSEEIGGTVAERNSYIVLNEDYTGCWIVQGVGMLTWDESQLTMTIGTVYDIALTWENDNVNLLVYEAQDESGAWIPTVFEKIDELPAEVQELFEEELNLQNGYSNRSA